MQSAYIHPPWSHREAQGQGEGEGDGEGERERVQYVNECIISGGNVYRIAFGTQLGPVDRRPMVNATHIYVHDI